MDKNALAKLSVAKTNYDIRPLLRDIVHKMFKSNSRLAYKTMFDRSGTPVGNDFFDKQDLEELKQAIFNREWDLKHRELDNVDNRKREISYENYKPLMIDGKYAGMAPFMSYDITERVKKYPYNKANYNMQTSIGSAQYDIDSNGNVKLHDQYDVNKRTHIRNHLLYIPHELIKHFGKPYDINIDLGNMKNWDKVYTGNSVYDYHRGQ